MGEKKKKRREGRYYRNLLLFLAMVLAVLAGFIAITVFVFPGVYPEPLYPAPPSRIEIYVEGTVVDAAIDSMFFQNAGIQVEVPIGVPGTGFETKHAAPGTSTFAGTSYADSASTGCIRGYLDIENQPRYEFAFGMNNIDFGADVQILLIVDGDEISPSPVIRASDIKPALAPDPVIRSGCQPGE